MLPDVFELVAEDKNDDDLLELIRPVFEEAMEKFSSSRNTEGEKLKLDLLKKMDEMAGLVSEIEAMSPDIIKEYKEKLYKKIEELPISGEIDEGRLAMEVTIYADKICVDEEIVRLKSHVAEIKETLGSDEAIGRKLDFLAQELNREANTILSKSQDPKVCDLGVQLKTLIEKVREQIQNIE